MMTGQKRPQLTKEDVNSWFDKRQTANRARREEKVTAEDIERRLIERKAARGGSMSSRLALGMPIGLGFAMLIATGAISVSVSEATRVFSVESAAVSRQLEVAQGELAAIPVIDQEEVETYAATLEGHLATARTAGQEVAALQQEFAAIIFGGNDSTLDGPVQAYQAAAKHQELLFDYFIERSLIAEGSAPGEGEIDPRHPWFIGYEDDGLTVVNPKTSAWELVSMAASETPGVFEATWLNRSDDGDLYAWATARYFVDGGKFGDLTVGKTTLGNDISTQISTAGE